MPSSGKQPAARPSESSIKGSDSQGSSLRSHKDFEGPMGRSPQRLLLKGATTEAWRNYLQNAVTSIFMKVYLFGYCYVNSRCQAGERRSMEEMNEAMCESWYWLPYKRRRTQVDRASRTSFRMDRRRMPRAEIRVDGEYVGAAACDGPPLGRSGVVSRLLPSQLVRVCSGPAVTLSVGPKSSIGCRHIQQGVVGL